MAPLLRLRVSARGNAQATDPSFVQCDVDAAPGILDEYNTMDERHVGIHID